MKRILHAKQNVKSKRAKVEKLLALSLDDVGREAKLLFKSELIPLGILLHRIIRRGTLILRELCGL